jgi:hypothetical protein
VNDDDSGFRIHNANAVEVRYVLITVMNQLRQFFDRSRLVRLNSLIVTIHDS